MTPTPGNATSFHYPAINEDFKALIPPMDPAEFQVLEESILNEGCHDPVVIWAGKGVVVDGHHRVSICRKHGLYCPTIEKAFDTLDDVHVFMIEKHIGRRNLTDFDRARLALMRKEKLKAKNSLRIIAGKAVDDPVKTRDELAAFARVGHDTIEKVEMIVKRGSPELIAAIQAEDVSIRTARTLADLPVEEQVQKLGLPKDMILQIAKEIRVKQQKEKVKQREDKLAAQRAVKPLKAIVELNEAIPFLSSFPDRSIDLLLTDPPYSTDIDDIKGFVESWVPLALSKIKLSGSAYIFIGAYPKEEAAYLNTLLSQDVFELQTLVWSYRNTLGPAPSKFYKQNWQMILFLRGPDSPELAAPNLLEQFSVQLFNAPDGRLGNRFHAWQKPYEIAEMFVRHASKEGDLVVDPFVCTGTHVLAAADLGRIARGCDNDPKALRIARDDRGCRWDDETQGVSPIGSGAASLAGDPDR